RISWLKNKIHQWCDILRQYSISDEKLYLATYHFLTLIKIFALKFKHDGFKEEREWRLIYMPDHDQQGVLKDRFVYMIGSRGVEPKLKVKIAPLPIEPQGNWKIGRAHV